jgi:hypothetical protein
MPVSTLLDVTGWCPERPRTRRATRLWLVSVFRQGWVRLLGALLRQEPWPQGRPVPEPWPAAPPLAGDPYAPGIVLPEAAWGKGREQRWEARQKRMHDPYLIKTAPCKAVTVGDTTYWTFTLAVRLPGLGKVRLVVSFRTAELTGTYVVLVSNRADWNAQPEVGTLFVTHYLSMP